jgi:hypothetical protein
MKKIAGIFCVLVSFVLTASAQWAIRTVTNADLEKYAQERIEADKQYRQNYASRGMLSPEEVQARADDRMNQTIELANKIRSDDLERRRLDLAAQAQILEARRLDAREAAEQSTAVVYYPNPYNGYGGYNGYILGGEGYGYYSGGYGYYGNRRYGRHYRGGFPVLGSGGYVSGGNLWPSISTPIFQWPVPGFGTGRRP